MVMQKLKFCNLDDIKVFIQQSTKQPFDIDIVNGHTQLDGKSFEGLASLDLGKEYDCVMHCNVDEASGFVNGMQVAKIGNMVQI